jgi:allophanate hydrolase
MTDSIWLAVAGAHLSGMPLNHELTERHAQLVRACRTSSEYELFALPGTTPPKPGLVRRPRAQGAGIEVEVWALSPCALGTFVAGVVAPMTIGNIELDDGTWVKGFSCEPYALEGAENITHFGGWRAYLAARRA